MKSPSTSEIQDHREKGICFYCDERCGPGHNCRKNATMLIFE